MDHVDVPIHAKMLLHAKVPLAAILGLVHVGIVFLGLVLCRTRGVNGGRVYNHSRKIICNLGSDLTEMKSRIKTKRKAL